MTLNANCSLILVACSVFVAACFNPEQSGTESGSTGSTGGGSDSSDSSDTTTTSATGLTAATMTMTSSDATTTEDDSSSTDNSGSTTAAECSDDEECPWSSCDNGTCANAIMIDGGQSGKRCAVRTSGDVACWGANWGGIAGDATNEPVYVPDPTLMLGLDGEGLLEDVVEIATGSGQQCALRSQGDVACWGVDFYGALGNAIASGDGTPQPPALVRSPSGSGSLDDVVHISGSGGYTTCGIRSEGDAVCWGRNTWGLLGDGSTDDSGLPRIVAGEGGVGTFQNIAAMSVGSSNACILNESEEVFCWGSGQGSVVAAEVHVPTAVEGVDGIGTLGAVVQVSIGFGSACVVFNTGNVACWGGNGDGQLGRDTGMTNTPTPGLVVDDDGPLDDIAEVSVGAGHACARTTGGEVLCWGRNSTGQLGQGGSGPETSIVPLSVDGIDGNGTLSGITRLGSGFGFTCGIREEGDIACWGLVVEIIEPYEIITSPLPALVGKPVVL